MSARVALVTGASGGIGAATARALAEGGWTLALHHAHTRAPKIPGGAAFKADLARPGAAAALVRAVLKRFGRLDLLVNNAGAVLGGTDFLTVSEREFAANLQLNLTAPFLLAREAFKVLPRGGRVVNVSSIAAKFGGSPRSMAYAAAKAGLEALTVSLAREGAPRGLLVNCVRPGVIDTPFHGKFRKAMGPRVAKIPLRRMGRAEDVALMVAHLAGPGGDYVTGQVFSVTGGE